MTAVTPHLKLKEVNRWICLYCEKTSDLLDWRPTENGLWTCPSCHMTQHETSIAPAFKYEWAGNPEDRADCTREFRRSGYWVCKFVCPGQIKGRCCFLGFELAPDMNPELRWMLRPVYEDASGGPEAPKGRKIVIKGDKNAR